MKVVVEADRGIHPRSVLAFNVTIAGQSPQPWGEPIDVWVQRGLVVVPRLPSLQPGIKVLESTATFAERWDPVEVHAAIVRHLYPARPDKHDREPDPRLLAEARVTGIARAYRVWQDPDTLEPSRFWVSIGFGWTGGPSVPVEAVIEGRKVKSGQCVDCWSRTCRHWWAVLAAVKQGVVKTAWVPPSGWNRYDEVTGEFTPMRGSRPIAFNGRRVG